MRGALLLTARFDPADTLLASFTAANRAAGAIVTFTGQMRGLGADGVPLAALILEAYRGMTLASLDDIAAAGITRFALTDALVVHRAGRIVPGETIVFVAVAAAHRRAAFEGADWLMDKLKTEALFWKSEETADGARRWIEPTAADHAAAARWAQP